MKSRRDSPRLAILGLLLACWYGPPERYRAFDEFMTAGDHSVTAYLRGFTALRLPRGLAAFPDGGMPRPAGSGAEVFLCDRGASRFRQVARVYVPPPMEGKAQYHLRGWIRDVVILDLGGASGTSIGVQSNGAIDAALASHHTAALASGLSEFALPECRRALDSLRHSDPVLNYTK